MSSKPLCNSNDNSSDISSVSPIKSSPVKVPSKTTESFQCNTNDDGDVCTLTPVKPSLSKEKCPVVSEQTSSTTKSLPSSNPIGSPKSSDFQHKSRHATTIKNKNYVVQRLHQRITSAKQKQNETNEPAEGEIIEVQTYKLLEGRRNKRTVWVKNCLYHLACDERDILMSENEWLTDDLILASQKILREQTSISGFQDPILGEKKNCFSITRENFIQILHDGYGHWFTVSTIRAQASNEVLIYDSMLHSLGGHWKKTSGSSFGMSREKRLVSR